MVLQTKSAIIPILLSCVLMIGCGKNNSILTIPSESLVIPDIHTEGSVSLVSDSGITRYRVEAEVWDVYSSVEEPYWHFPEGAYLERFDSIFQVDVFVRADTVYFFESKELWRLIGNVFVQNQEGNTFETAELFWNQKEPADSPQAIYTDKEVRIKTGEDITLSQGLRANQSMSYYQMYEGGGEYLIQDNPKPAPTDSISP